MFNPENKFCYIKSEFFQEFAQKFGIKSEHYFKRPFYCVQKNKNGICWVIPLSSRWEKYRERETEREKLGKKSNLFWVAGEDILAQGIYKIDNAFPITEKYIKDYYLAGAQPKVLNNHEVRSEIKRKFVIWLNQSRTLSTIEFSALIAELLKEEREPVRKVLIATNHKQKKPKGYKGGRFIKGNNPTSKNKKRAIEEMRRNDMF